jgi:hypothetical protein
VIYGDAAADETAGERRNGMRSHSSAALAVVWKGAVDGGDDAGEKTMTLVKTGTTGPPFRQYTKI